MSDTSPKKRLTPAEIKDEWDKIYRERQRRMFPRKKRDDDASDSVIFL